MKKGIIFLWIAFFTVHIDAVSLFRLLDVDTVICLEDFAQFIDISCTDIPSFFEYYQNFSKKLSAKNDNKKKEIKQRITQQALNALEIAHADWFDEIQQFKSKTIFLGNPRHLAQRNISMFLIFYGILDQFYYRQMRATASFWNRFKSYTGQIKTNVTAWLSDYS